MPDCACVLHFHKCVVHSVNGSSRQTGAFSTCTSKPIRLQRRLIDSAKLLLAQIICLAQILYTLASPASALRAKPSSWAGSGFRQGPMLHLTCCALLRCTSTRSCRTLLQPGQRPGPAACTRGAQALAQLAGLLSLPVLCRMWGRNAREAALRMCMTRDGKVLSNVELRPSDSTQNSTLLCLVAAEASCCVSQRHMRVCACLSLLGAPCEHGCWPCLHVRVQACSRHMQATSPWLRCWRQACGGWSRVPRCLSL